MLSQAILLTENGTQCDTIWVTLLNEGFRPAAALRAAQLEMIQGDRWILPYC